MRVIAGSCRGRKLYAPSGMVTRPTSDRVKESLFNILVSRTDFFGAHVLDICAGTGSLGIEALSRGASRCSFIESDTSAVECITRNLRAARFTDRSDVIKADAVNALNKIVLSSDSFTLAFLDPPYESDIYDTVLALLGASRILSAGSVVVAECASGRTLGNSYGKLHHVDRRVYGDTALELFVMED